ncbi:S-adenosyl-L-methionine-dependent methyltransferase [Cercophora samala]|uniref:S-adenosyl-L-methionine-dependent methyltransferase n=1 Tax=Cercophora samala TaxID=330535 RepID=A0AA39ZFJ1_9PEZI|nr:S-adenosyl-L-methionine-dependent methyltransferase [Cercophora samala]
MATTQTETRPASVLSREKVATEKDPVHISLCGVEVRSVSSDKGALRNDSWRGNEGHIAITPLRKDGTTTNIVKSPSTFSRSTNPSNDSSSPRSHSELMNLAQEISAHLTEATSGSEPARLKVATAALQLAAALRPPSDAIMSLFANMSVVSAIRVFHHWGVLDLLPPDPTRGTACHEIARLINAEEGIVSRIAGMLTSSRVLSLTPAGEVCHTATSLLLRSSEPMAAMFDLMYNNVVRVSDILPAYFDRYGKAEPVGPGRVPATVLSGEAEMGYFESVARDEERMSRFTRAMAVASGRVPVLGIYPLENMLLKEDMEGDGGRVTWVDVGGGGGHVLRRFRKDCAALRKGRCVVVDLRGVVDQGRIEAEGDEVMRGVEWLEGDFMREMTVEGARFYYLRHIVRDYSDPVATLVLRNVAQAMNRDSRILVSEQINPDGGGTTGRPMPLYSAFKDYSMLAIGGKERSLAQFERIGKEAGLRVEAVYRDSKGTEHGVIEFVLEG